MNNLLFDTGAIQKGADFSECGKYRYRLWRIWNRGLPLAMVIGLNPSTANADKDDQTIGNLRRILSILGYGGFYMMNCWPFITSKPKELQIDDATNFENTNRLLATALIVDEVIFAWGNFKIIKDKKRDVELAEIFPTAKCLGKTKSGAPFHPLALMYKGAVKSPKLERYLQPSPPTDNKP